MTRYENLNAFCELLKVRQDNDWDSLIVITGEERISKSTCAIQIMKRVIPNFSLERNMVYNNSEIMNKFYELKKKDGLIVDEAVRAFFKRDFAKARQKILIKMLAQVGFKNHLIILNLPNFLDCDSQIRNWRCLFWIHVIKRGQAFIFKRSESAFDKTDPWLLDKNRKKISLTYKGSSDSLYKLMKGYNKTSIKYGTITYPDLTPRMKDRYREISEARKLEEDIDEDMNKYKAALINSLYIRYIQGVKCSVLAKEDCKGLFSRSIINKWMLAKKREII